MKKFSFVFAILAALALTACGTTNSYMAQRHTTVEMYHIFDIQTKADTATVAKAASDGLPRNTNEISSNMPLHLGTTVPPQASRFTIEDMGAKLSGTGMGTFMQMAAMQNGGVSIKAARCDDAVWTARAVRNIAGSSNLTLYGCLYKYAGGYHLDTYAVFQKTEGGLNQISRDIAGSMVGTPEQWVDKTIQDMVASIETGARAQVVHLEGQPQLGAKSAVAQR